MSRTTREVLRALVAILTPGGSALATWLVGELSGRGAIGTAVVGTLAVVSTLLQDSPMPPKGEPPPEQK